MLLKRFLASLIVLLSASASFAGTVTFFGESDKNPLEYAPGETMIFSIQCLEDDKAVDGRKLTWTRTGDDGKTETGTALSSATEPLKIETSIDVPGFVRIQVFALDEKGAIVPGESAQFNGGAGVLLDKIDGSEEPADFDEFWSKQKAVLARVPLKYALTPVDSGDASVVAYDVKVDCAGLAPVSGYLCMPKDAKEKSLAAHVAYQGYGVGSANKNLWIGKTKIYFEINAHGILNGMTPEYYQGLRETFLAGYGFDAKENSNPASAYWTGMALRAIRALEFVKALPEWDGENLTTSGGSQGGLQCLTAAGLDSDVTEVDAYVPWFCDLAGKSKNARLGGWFPEWVDGLGYFDSTNHAKRIRAKKVTIHSGLGDYVCPPSGQVVLYRAINVPTKWIVNQGKTHGFNMKNAPEYVLEKGARE